MVLGTEDADSISTPTKAAAHANTNMDHVSTNEPVLWVGAAPSEKADAGASPTNMAKFNLALNEEAHSCSTLNIAPWGYETTPAMFSDAIQYTKTINATRATFIADRLEATTSGNVPTQETEDPADSGKQAGSLRTNNPPRSSVGRSSGCREVDENPGGAGRRRRNDHAHVPRRHPGEGRHSRNRGAPAGRGDGAGPGRP